MTLALALLLGGVAQARPTDGGPMGFASDDVIASYDTPEGGVRVHYAVEGPSVTRLADLDGDGVPDFVALVGGMVEAAWEVDVAAGFRAPLREADVGLGPLGGSPAFDVYLVDFDGGADGAFRVDGCQGGVCAGHLLIENDFRGHGYPSLDDAVATLASHELFHAVQYAYTSELSVWMSEGMAVWAQRLFDPQNQDFLRFAQAYLEDAGRSLDKPPIGPVPTFAYATGLWFDFVALQLGEGAIAELLERLAEPQTDEIDALVDVFGQHDRDLAASWLDFASWNLATADRAGVVEGYPYAAELRRGVEATLEGRANEETRRFFPLATTYYRVDHDGGALRVASEACDARLRVRVHPVVGGASDGVVGPALQGEASVGEWVFPGPGQELEPGAYWVVVSLPEPAPQSVHTLLCAGSERWCAVRPQCDEPAEPEPEVPAGCGCAAGAVQGPGAWGRTGIVSLAGLLLIGLRRRL